MSYRYIAETLQVGLGLPGTGLEREAILTYTWGLGISEGDKVLLPKLVIFRSKNSAGILGRVWLAASSWLAEAGAADDHFQSAALPMEVNDGPQAQV